MTGDQIRRLEIVFPERGHIAAARYNLTSLPSASMTQAQAQSQVQLYGGAPRIGEGNLLTPQSSPVKSSFPPASASSLSSSNQFQPQYTFPQTQTQTQLTPHTPYISTIALPPLPIRFPSSSSSSSQSIYSSSRMHLPPGRAGVLRVQTQLSVPTTINGGPLTPPPSGAKLGVECDADGEGEGEGDETVRTEDIRRSIEKLVTDFDFDLEAYGDGGDVRGEGRDDGRVGRSRSMTMSSNASTASLGNTINLFPLPPFSTSSSSNANTNTSNNVFAFPRLSIPPISAPAMGMRNGQFFPPSPPNSASAPSFPPRSAPASTTTTRFSELGLGTRDYHGNRAHQQQQQFPNSSQHVASMMGLPRLPSGLSRIGKLPPPPPPSFPPRSAGPHPPFPSPSLPLARHSLAPSSQGQGQSQGKGGSTTTTTTTTSQCVLTPDGKALAASYGPWTLVDVSPDPSNNSIVLSWPAGYALPR